jgi:hypothetical protein
MFRQRSVRRNSAWLLTCLAIGMSQACSRPDAFRRTDATAEPSSGAQKLPFHPAADHPADDPARPALPDDQKTAENAPFHDSQHPMLPAGTLITVRLQKSFSIAQVQPGDTFAASLVSPIVIGGNTLIDSGTPVSARIESTQPPLDRKPALVRLSLSTVQIDGRVVSLETSSLFAKCTLPRRGMSQTRGEKQTWGGYRLPKGRELTFRLTAPVTLSNVKLADRR